MTPSPATGHSSAATSLPPATRVPPRIREYSLRSFTPFSSRVARTPFVRWACAVPCESWPCSARRHCRRTEPSNEYSGPRSRVSHEAQHIRSLHVPRRFARIRRRSTCPSNPLAVTPLSNSGASETPRMPTTTCACTATLAQRVTYATDRHGRSFEGARLSIQVR